MELHCKSTFYKSILFLTLMLFFPLNTLLTTLFLINLDYILSINFIYSIVTLFTNKPAAPTTFNITDEKHKKDDTTTNNALNKKPILSIDTSSTTIPQITVSQLAKNPPTTISHNSPLELTTTKMVTRKRHYSISSYNQPETPHLSPTSSISSFSSNWSTDSKRSHVEEMIYLFETGHKIHRRYSMDSHSYRKPLYIRERKYEYKPIASEWKKRTTDGSNNNIQLSPSISTPLRHKMAPIPEKSKSTWA